MPWGSSSRFHKRQRNVEYCSVCNECEIEEDRDDYVLCGACQSFMCEDCLDESCVCAECEANDKLDPPVYTAEGSSCCLGCTATCDEPTCEDLAFHDCCIEEHKKKCGKATPAQRRLAAAEKNVCETEIALRSAKEQLSVLQGRVSQLKGELVAAEKEKKAALKMNN